MHGDRLLYGNLDGVRGGRTKTTVDLSSLLLFHQILELSLESDKVPVKMIVFLFQLVLRLKNGCPSLLPCEGFSSQVVVFVVPDNVRKLMRWEDSQMRDDTS